MTRWQHVMGIFPAVIWNSFSTFQLPSWSSKKKKVGHWSSSLSFHVIWFLKPLANLERTNFFLYFTVFFWKLGKIGLPIGNSGSTNVNQGRIQDFPCLFFTKTENRSLESTASLIEYFRLLIFANILDEGKAQFTLGKRLKRLNFFLFCYCFIFYRKSILYFLVAT